MVSQNRVNIPPIARKNVTQRGGMADVVCMLVCVSVLDIANVYIYIVSYHPVQKYSTTTKFIYMLHI